MVVAVLLDPVPVAFVLVLAVVRISLYLLALRAVRSQPSALPPAAIVVVLYAGIGNKRSSAVGIGAPALLGHGFLSRPGLFPAIDLRC